MVLANQKPVVVAYVPTVYAKSLNDTISSLADWGVKHKKKITGK